MAVLFASLYLFIKVGSFHEMLVMTIGSSLYIVYLIGIPALLLTIASGVMRNALAQTPGKIWLLFTVWLFLTVPLSTWRAESLKMSIGFVQYTFALFLIIGSLPANLKEFRTMMTAVGLSSVCGIYLGRLLAKSGDEGPRLALGVGSIGNSNDFAAQMLFVLPFLLFLILTKTHAIIKVVAVALVFFALYPIAQSGSRGAMLAAAAGGLFVVLRGPAKIRLVALFSIPVLLAVLLTALPPALLQRYATAFTSDAAVNSEAMESSRLRKYLLQKSIEISIQNPLFGIGINQFPSYEGSQARARGEHGAWLVSHNSYTQLSSETGFPGLLLVLAATISTFRLLNRLYGYRHRPEPAAKIIANAAFCLMLSQVVFGVAIFFLAMAYGPNLLILSGFAVSLHRVALRELPQEQRKLNPALQPSLKYAPR